MIPIKIVGELRFEGLMFSNSLVICLYEFSQIIPPIGRYYRILVVPELSELYQAKNRL